MDYYLGKHIEKISVKIISAKNRSDNILGFAELLIFEENQLDPIFKIKGFTIKKKLFNDKEVICVVFPAFKSGFKYQTSFIIEDKNIWSDIDKLILNAFYAIAGDGSLDATNGTYVEPDDVPF